MSKYNYFDDDDDIVEKEKTPSAPKKLTKQEIADAIKAFSVTEKTKIQRVARTISDTDSIDKLFRRKKRTVTFVLIIVVIVVFAIMIATVAVQMNVENSRISKFNADAGEVCVNYITEYGNCSYENLYTNYGIEGYSMTGLSYVREMDFDGDGKSELLICYNDGGVYFVEVWGYNSDNDFVSLFCHKATQTNDKADDAWITIYHHNNNYYIGVHNEEDITQVDLYTLKGDEFEQKSTCTYEPQDQAFIVRKKINYTDFERIKLSVLREEKAVVTSDLVSNVIDGFTSTNDADTTVSSSQGINNAYYSIVSDYNQRYGVASYKESDGLAYLDGLAVVKLVDFNNDDQNELMLIYRKGVMVRDEDSNGDYISKVEYKYFCEIYRYNGTTASLVYENEGLSSMLNDTDDVYTILKNQNKKYYLCNNTFTSSNYGKVITGVSNIYKFDGTTFKSQLKAEYVTEYGWSDYYIDGEEVSKNTFNEKGYTVPYFDGTADYDSDNYEVIFLQRKTSKSGNLESQVNETQSTIQKLNSSYSGK
jgi:hypothetical protein